MTATIDLFERTGTAGAPISENATNNNWKSEDRKDSLYKYYYYPIKRPEGDVWVNHSASRYMYARISGTFSQIKRVRWKITGLGMTSGLRLYLKQTHTYVEPTIDFDGSLIYGNTSPLYIYPNLSTSGPTSATTRIHTLASNTTYYTDFIKSQLWIDDTTDVFDDDGNLIEQYVGNSDVIKFELQMDEYE